jgi:hypothetical protein
VQIYELIKIYKEIHQSTWVGEEQMENKEEMHKFASGAKSTEEAPRFDLLPLEPMYALIKRFSKGLKKHGHFNWLKGVNDEDFKCDRRNHLLHHTWCYVLGLTTVDGKGDTDTPEDHLDAIITNAAMLLTLDKYSSNDKRSTPYAELINEYNSRNKGKSSPEPVDRFEVAKNWWNNLPESPAKGGMWEEVYRLAGGREWSEDGKILWLYGKYANTKKYSDIREDDRSQGKAGNS